MYRDYYGLIEKPFRLTPDPKFFFGQAGHAEARDLLHYGIREREGFMCFIGPAGTGKTTMLRTALESLGDDAVTAMIFNPQISEEDLLRIILVDFGIIPQAEFDSDVARALGKQEMLEYLNGFLLDLSAQGRTAVLVVDEAQNLPLPTMEQIRLLSNLETNKQKLIQIVLAGQLGLRRLLETPELSQLAQRVSVRYTMNAFGVDDVARYVEHRLRVAGNCGDVSFDPTAYAAIHRYSEGVPRLVNLLADRALLAGYAQQSAVVTGAMVDAAATTLELTSGSVPVERPAAPVVPVAVPEKAPAATSESPAESPVPNSHSKYFAEPPPVADNGFRPWQAAVGVVLAAVITVGGYTGLQWSQVPQLPAPAEFRAEGGSEHFNSSAPSLALRTPQSAYTIYLSSHRDPSETALTQLQRDLETGGFDTYLVAADVAGQGTLYRLTVGAYADRSAAAAAATQLREAHGVAHAEAVAVPDVTGS
ncbi:MAG: AAA family ATPase [Acidobacteria bacterium]|nr:AAA family ATPase [Acidobacteriota bacterium]